MKNRASHEAFSLGCGRAELLGRGSTARHHELSGTLWDDVKGQEQEGQVHLNTVSLRAVSAFWALTGPPLPTALASLHSFLRWL